jgi:hypothetical protein
MATVYMCHPFYGGVVAGSSRAFWTKPGGKNQYIPAEGGGSALGQVFNTLLCGALTLRDMGQADLDWFVMLHSDVIPPAGWVDRLVELATEHRCDVLSVALAIKDPKGLTSTAIDDPADRFQPIRRITMRELHMLPETFTAADCGYPDHALLVNTGCMIFNFKAPWVPTPEDPGFPGFTMEDCIRYHPDKKIWKAYLNPEDWQFSRYVHSRGGKVCATRALVVEHEGTIKFTNESPWGQWEVDEAFGHKFDRKPLPGLVRDPGVVVTSRSVDLVEAGAGPAGP